MYIAEARMMTVPTMDSGGGVVWKITRSNTNAKMICGIITRESPLHGVSRYEEVLPGCTLPSSRGLQFPDEDP